MEYRVEGIIRFHPTSKIKLSESLSFSSPSGVQVALNSASNDNLSVQIVLEADDKAAAEEMAAIELDRISNLLSYFHDVSVERGSITGMSSIQVDAKGTRIVVGAATVSVGATLSVVKKLDPKSAEELRYQLEKIHPVDFEDAASMWREAISTESPPLKYMLLYRLMEYMFKSDTKALTAWLIQKDPSVQTLNDRERGDTTIYTYLRDNIHPKTKLFPHTQMNNALPRFQELVKQAIEEKFGCKSTCPASGFGGY